MTAPTLDRERLAKLCGLFGSDHAGERANAAACADRLVRQAGLRWPDILSVLSATERASWPNSRTADADDYLAYLADRMADLTAWEQDFVLSLRARSGRFLTDKQRACVLAVAERIRRAERRAERAAA